MVVQPGLFDLQDRYAGLSNSGDPLERLLTVVNFEVFRPPLDEVLVFNMPMLRPRTWSTAKAIWN